MNSPRVTPEMQEKLATIRAARDAQQKQRNERPTLRWGAWNAAWQGAVAGAAIAVILVLWFALDEHSSFYLGGDGGTAFEKIVQEVIPWMAVAGAGLFCVAREVINAFVRVDVAPKG